MAKPGARTLVKTWVGFVILAIVLAVAGYLVVQYAPKADVSYVANAKCKPKKKKACFVMTVTDAKTGRLVSDATVEVTVNDTTTRKLLELGTTTDAAGVATLSLRMAKRAGGYTGSYVVKKTGYSTGVGSFRGTDINPNKKIVVSKSITPNTTTPSPSVPPIGDGGDTTPEERCQPVSSPVSAAHACLAVKVVDEDREPVAGAWVSAPGYITLAETGNGLNGTVLGQTAFFPIRMTKASNGWIPVKFNIKVSYQGKEVTIAQAGTDSALTAFVGKAQAATTKQVTITSPRSLLFQTIGDFPDDTGDGGDEVASCPAPAGATSYNPLNPFSVEKARATDPTGIACVSISDKVDIANEDYSSFFGNLVRRGTIKVHAFNQIAASQFEKVASLYPENGVASFAGLNIKDNYIYKTQKTTDPKAFYVFAIHDLVSDTPLSITTSDGKKWNCRGSTYAELAKVGTTDTFFGSSSNRLIISCKATVELKVKFQAKDETGKVFVKSVRFQIREKGDPDTTKNYMTSRTTDSLTEVSLDNARDYQFRITPIADGEYYEGDDSKQYVPFAATEWSNENIISRQDLQHPADDPTMTFNLRLKTGASPAPSPNSAPIKKNF